MKIEWLKGRLDNEHVALETTTSIVIITWMGCLENGENNDALIKVGISYYNSINA